MTDPEEQIDYYYILIRCNFDCSYWKRPVQWEFCTNIIQKIWDKTMKGYLKRHCNIHCIRDKWNGKTRKLPNFSLANWLFNYKQFIKERFYLSLNKYYLLTLHALYTYKYIYKCTCIYFICMLYIYIYLPYLNIYQFLIPLIFDWMW